MICLPIRSFLSRVGSLLACCALWVVLFANAGCGASKMSSPRAVGAQAPAGYGYAPAAPAPASEAPPSDAEEAGAAASDEPEEPAARTTTADSPPAQPAPPPPLKTAPPIGPGTPPQLAPDASPLAQMLIYSARLVLAVLEVDKSLMQIETIAREAGGLLSHRTDRQIVVRVPTAKFSEVLKQIEAVGELKHKNVQVADVSEQYRDLALRLKNAREVRDRLAALLANAKTVEESLKVERELERLSAEIQRIEGRLKYLRDRAEWSTITVQLDQLQTEDLKRRKHFRLPFPWLSTLGLGHLLNVH